jgi:hypothetical protein
MKNVRNMTNRNTLRAFVVMKFMLMFMINEFRPKCFENELYLKMCTTVCCQPNVRSNVFLKLAETENEKVL